MPEYYLEGINKPEINMRSMTIIFYGTDPDQARTLASLERDAKRSAMLRDAAVFWGEEEECDTVWIMPKVTAHHRARIKRTYGKKALDLKEDEVPQVVTVTAQPPPVEVHRPPPPPAPVKEQALPEREVTVPTPAVDYRQMTNKELRALASQRRINTRNATNKDQLIKLLSAGPAM